MMFPPVFEVAYQSNRVRDLLGTLPTRLYPFAEAPPDPEIPYAVWQLISGIPENFLNQVPDADSWSVQLDIYASSAAQTREVAKALRDAFEPVCHIIGWGFEGRDAETKLYRRSFDMDWIERRVVFTVGLSGDQAGSLLLSGDQQITGRDKVVVNA